MLSFSIGPPDAVDSRLKNLDGIKVESKFHRLANLHVLQILLRVAGQQIAVAMMNAAIPPMR